MRITIQVAPDDCTGCGVCVDVCPAKHKDAGRSTRRSTWSRSCEHLDVERAAVRLLPRRSPTDRPDAVDAGHGQGLAAARAAVRVLRRLRGLRRDAVPEAAHAAVRRPDRSSPTPRAARRSTAATCRPRRGRANADGRGPAWSNSLFEDNAEFGLGMRLALDQTRRVRRRSCSTRLARSSATTWSRRSSTPTSATRPAIAAQRERVARAANGVLAARSRRTDAPQPASPSPTRSCARACGSSAATAGPTTSASAASTTCSRSGRDVNVLVLDTEVYSNTGGQASKATPRGAVAKFAAGGKRMAKKDLGLIATAYGNVYVAQIALGADNPQTVKALRRGRGVGRPVAVIAYCHLHRARDRHATSMSHQKRGGEVRLLAAVPLRPEDGREGKHPFQLDSQGAARCPSRSSRRKRRGSRCSRASRPEASSELLRNSPRPTPTSAGTSTSSSPASRATRPDRSRRTGRRGARRQGGGGGNMSADLTTRYLGLELKNPLVPSAARCSARTRHLQAPARTPGPRRSCCTRCSRSRSRTRLETDRVLRARARRASPSR